MITIIGKQKAVEKAKEELEATIKEIVRSRSAFSPASRVAIEFYFYSREIILPG